MYSVLINDRFVACDLIVILQINEALVVFQVFQVNQDQVRPFLYHVFSTSPFQSLFKPAEQQILRGRSGSFLQPVQAPLSRASSRDSVKSEGHGTLRGSLGDILNTFNPARLLQERSKQAVKNRRDSLTLTSSKDGSRGSLTSLIKSTDTSPERMVGVYNRQISSSTGNLNESGYVKLTWNYYIN